ncbi:MAG TPA: transketolase C-terminal domain-containing protein [Candidatus Limnocylindria bacterium]|nr:transketolase C-terminal domain-containing protein [Candidatus Limnocylindria bacterium]
MRGAFVRTLTELAAADERILLLTGDLGFMALEPFHDRFPGRFFNMGVAEQNMVGVATGLAEAGFVPYVYSIATFAVLRPYEFIRNGPIWHALPVRIVGIGGGFEYGTQGLSHHAVEDLGVMRIQPGIRVIAPADHRQAEAAIRQSWDHPGPIYYRLGKDDRTTVPGLDGRFTPDGIDTIGDGTDVALVATGSVAVEAVAAADLLRERGVSATVAIVSTLQPAPEAALAALLRRVPRALSVEAHYVTGGVGSLVAEVIAEHALPCRLVRCGVRAVSDGRSGSQQYMHARHGLTRTGLAETALAALARPGT